MPLLNIQAEDISILTHEAAAERWKLKGYNAVSNYKQLPKNDETIRESIVVAEAIFWTSFSQYEFYGKYAKAGCKTFMCWRRNCGVIKASRSRAGNISNN